VSVLALIAVLTVGTVGLKAAGPLLAGGRQPPGAAVAVIALLTPALVTALIVTGTFVQDDAGGPAIVVLDARAAGLAAGGALLWLRAPAVVALAGAAVVTATLRALG
jgi:hypothetical protein